MSLEINNKDKRKAPITDLVEAGNGSKEDSSTIKSATYKKNTSDCWNHFSKIIDEKIGKAISVKCIHCAIVLKYITGNGTSSMRKHLTTCKKFPRNLDKRQKFFVSRNSTGKEGDSSTRSVLSTWTFNQDRSRQKLAEFIIVDEQPFALVERVKFREYVSELQPLFKHISRFTVARDCMKLYLSEITSLKTNLSQCTSKIALTTDTWTSIQNVNYLCLTAHFIDKNWKLQKRIINFVVMHSHKGREIGKMVEKCIYEWEIEKKISTITVDNASSNDTAISYLKEKLSREELLILGGDVLHMRCTTHILNLIVRDGLDTVGDSIARIRNVVKYVRSSPMRAKTFHTCIESERITYKGSVCLDVSTRWNSTYLMLDTALKFRKAFERMEEEDLSFAGELNFDLPKNEDWENTTILSDFLKQFYDATKQMSGSSYITSSDYFEGIVFLYKYLKDAANAFDSKLQLMGTKMKDKFDKYYGGLDKVNMMVLIAVVLDPTKKLNYVSFCYQNIYDDASKISEMQMKVKNALERLFLFYEQSFTKNSQTLGDQNMSATSSGSKAGDDKYDIQVWRKNFMLSKKRVHDDSKSELDRYLEDEGEDILDIDLLIWWKTNGSKYKILSLIARDVLSIPVTTVALESTFSTSGRVLDGFQSSLTPKVVEALICTQDWLRAICMSNNVEVGVEDAETFESDMDCLNEDIIVNN